MRRAHTIRILAMQLFLLLWAGFCAAATPGDWSSRLSAIWSDGQMGDSIRIVNSCELTLNYAYFYREIGEDQIDQFLSVVLPPADRLHTEDIKILIYTTAMMMALPGERLAELSERTLYYTDQGRDPKLRFTGWMRLGQTNIESSLAIKYFLLALNEVDETDDYFRRSQAYRNISVYYREQLDHQNSLKYAKLSLESAFKSEDVRSIAQSWREMGYAYYETPGRVYWDQALEAYNETTRLYRERILPTETDPDTAYVDNLYYMITLVNTGLFYYDLNRPREAISYLLEALDIAIPIGMTESAAFCYKQLGLISQQARQYDLALEYYNQAEQLLGGDYFRTRESDYLEYEILLAKASLYQETGRYRQSAEAYRDGIEQYREVFDAEILLENQKLAAFYENARQEEELRRIETIVAYRNRQWYFRLGIIVMVALVMVFVLLMYRYRIRLASQKEQRLEDEARRIELENSKAELLFRLKQQETEDLKTKLEKGSKLIEMRNSMLNNLKTFFAAHSELNPYRSRIESIILQQNRVEGNVNEFRSGMQDVPADFNRKLQDKASGRLTPLDLKYCRLIYLNTPTREMAKILFVEARSVRVNKYRLKQKFSLGKDEDLASFIHKTALE